MPAATPTAVFTDKADGTGATCVITGSTAGSANKVLCARWNAGVLSRSFSQLASRVGDGSVDVPIAGTALGLYDALVRSEVASNDVALSNIVGFRATDGESAIHYQCCVAVQEIIQALSLEDMESENVRIMKLPWRGYSEIGQLGIIISPIREGLETADNERDDMDYRIQVCFLEAKDGDLEPDEVSLLRRQRVVQAFSEKLLPNVTGHYITFVDPGPIIIPEGVEANYDVGGILLHPMCQVNRRVT